MARQLKSVKADKHVTYEEEGYEVKKRYQRLSREKKTEFSSLVETCLRAVLTTARWFCGSPPDVLLVCKESRQP